MNDNIMPRTHFIKSMIEEDIKNQKYPSIITRFPPEPNGYLHIGHAKSMSINFSMAEQYDGKCYLRFDDTNPIKEEEKYIEGIKEDVEWMGFSWDKLTYSSDYYDDFYKMAISLIEMGLAYVDDLSLEEIRDYRGTLQTKGKNSPYRDRSIAENLSLFQGMLEGKYADGKRVLRAKIDMSSGNLNMRDPVLYRIRHVHHARTGDKWCIYPMYDYAHPLSDALENISHSLCTLEFQDHRPLYDWFINHLPVPGKPEQTEFARLNISHTVLSKRKLKTLVDNKVVDGWDDPRLLTIRGMRHRGYPASAIRKFCHEIGVSKSDALIDMSILENCVRDELNTTSKRAMCVLNPIKIFIENYSEVVTDSLNAAYHPQTPDLGYRTIPFTQTLYIERDDFMLEPVKKFHRLAPGKEVRLRNAYIIQCKEVIYDESGQISLLKCTLDPDTLGKNPSDRKVKGVIHWVSATEHQEITVYDYDRLFLEAQPGMDDDFLQEINPNSLKILKAYCESAMTLSEVDEVFQFERIGYYKVQNNSSDSFMVNRVVNLKDTWSKIV